jgi:hypothetical protein
MERHREGDESMRHFILGSVLPALLAVALFVGALPPLYPSSSGSSPRRNADDPRLPPLNISRAEHDEVSGALTRAGAGARSTRSATSTTAPR